MSSDSFDMYNDSMDRNRSIIMEYYEDTINFEHRIGIIIPVLFALIIFIGLFGNILVILVVALNHQMRNSTNYLIISLAMSDVIFLIFCVPFTAADYALPIWAFSHWWCSALYYLQFVSAYASVWTLVLMAMDRFLAVVYPVQSITLRSTRNTSLALMILWAIILLSCIPEYFEHQVFQYWFIAEDRTTCVYVAGLTRAGSNFAVRMYYLSFCVCGFLLPLGIASTLYALMLRKLWSMPKLGNTATAFSASCSKEEKKKAHTRPNTKKKVTYMVTGVIVVFAICWLPMNICFVVRALLYPSPVYQSNKVFVYFSIVSQVLAYTNSCVNPILYAFLSDNFRRGFVKIFGFIFIYSQEKGRTLRSVKFNPSVTNAAGAVDQKETDGLLRNNSDDQKVNSKLLTVDSPAIARCPRQSSSTNEDQSITIVDFTTIAKCPRQTSSTSEDPLNTFATNASKYDDILVMIDDSIGSFV